MIPKYITLNNVSKALKALNTKPCMNNNSLGTKQIRYGFSQSSAKEQFLKTFLVKIHYNNPTDAYYQTYPHREVFRKQVKQLQDSNKCYIFGGDLFPFESTQLVVNCDEKTVIENFLNKNVYQDKKLIKDYQIEEVEKVTEQKMKKLSYFYQYA